MGKPSSSERVAQIVSVERPTINSGRFKEIFENPLSPEAVRKNKERRNRIASIQRAEQASRKTEEPKLRTCEMFFGMRPFEPVKKANILDEEHKLVLKTAIAESGGTEEEQNDLRQTSIGSLQFQEVFVASYKKWMAEWEADANPEKPDFKEYLRLKGRDYIKEYAKELRAQRIEMFFEKNRDKAGLSDEEMIKSKEDFRKAMDMYFQANGVAMAELNSLDAEERKMQRDVLLAKFKKVLAENGLEKVEAVRLEALFDTLVGDFEYEYAQYEIWEATYEVMYEMGGLDLSPEEWEKRRQAALKKNAKGELQEYLQQQTAPVYTGTTESVSSGYRDVYAVGHACGVNLEQVEPDIYKVSAPAVADRSFSPLVRVKYNPPDRRVPENAIFWIQQPWRDEDDKGGGDTLKGVLTKSYNLKEVIGGFNEAMLDYVLNKKINIVLPENAKMGTNRIIRGEQMVRLAERLLKPFNIADRPIRENELNIFQRFMEVVLRADTDPLYSSLQQRVKKAQEMVEKDSESKLRKVFEEPGSTAWTLGSLEEKLGLKGK